MRVLVIIVGIGLLFISGCGKEKIVSVINLQEQKVKDVAIINDYISNNNLGEFDTTASGARFIILNRGDGDSIHYNDIVAVDYIGMSITGNVFDTSIPEVADTAFTDAIQFFLEPQVFTYTRTGWALDFVRLTGQFISDGNVQGRGLAEALTDALIRMQVGGKLLVFLPSDQAFEGRPTIYFPAYSVIMYEIYVVEVPK